MKRIFPILLPALAVLPGIGARAPDRPKGHPDPQTCQLGPEEAAKLKQIEGKYALPRFRVPSPKYAAGWKKIASYPVPKWFVDAKFGMYTHWGLYSIPGFRPTGNTYLRHMYKHDREDPKNAYEYHRKNYGDPNEFGYTDFVPKFRCEKFDGREYVDVMRSAGARFGGLCVVHHDGYCLWDSKVTRWDVGSTGPKRDIYGEFVQAARRSSFKVAATFHHARSYGWAYGEIKRGDFTEEQKRKLDLFAPQFTDFFYPKDRMTPERFARQWHDKIVEVMDKYKPDMIWFDGLGMDRPHSPEKLVVDYLKHYYETAEADGREVVVCNKLPSGNWFNYTEGVGMRCYEGGRSMPPNTGGYFLIDRAISYPWSWCRNKVYNLDAGYHVDALVDHVARGGIYLLSLTPMGSGEIPPEEKRICRKIGNWLRVNGEAIYGTRRWAIPAEGPVTVWELDEKRGRIQWNYRRTSARQIRFTQKGDALYALTLGWPEDGKVTIKALRIGSPHYAGQIKSVTLLGSPGPVKFKRTDEGLKLVLPAAKPCDYAYALRIEGKPAESDGS